MKIKLLTWGFGGCEYYKNGTSPKSFDECKPCRNGSFYLKEFNGMKGKTIKISNIHKFPNCSLFRFFYEGYCCVIDQKDYQLIEKL